MKLKRPNLREVYKNMSRKDRLLYGAVFLFCIVCVYGWSNNVWDIFDESAGSPITAEQQSENVREKMIQGDKGNEQDKTGTGGRCKVNIASIERAWPMDNPFDGISSHGEGAAFTAQIEESSAYTKQSAEAKNRKGNPVIAPSEIPRLYRQKNTVSTPTASSHADKVNLVLRGTVTGRTPVAVIEVNGKEGTYQCGEKVGGAYIESIDEEGVLIREKGGTRRLYNH